MTRRGSGVLEVTLALMSVTVSIPLNAEDAPQSASRPALGVRFVQGHTVTVIDVVPGSPADRAGLRIGDTIRGIDGDRVASTDAFIQAIAALPVGESAALRVERNGGGETISISLTEWDAVFDSLETTLSGATRANRLSYVSLLDDADTPEPEEAASSTGCCPSPYYCPAGGGYGDALFYYPIAGCCDGAFPVYMYPPTYTSAWYVAPGNTTPLYYWPVSLGW